MIKKIVLIVVFFVLLSCDFSAHAVDYNEYYNKEFEEYGLEELEEMLPEEYKDFFDDLGIDISNFESFENITAGNIFDLIIDLFTGGIKKPFLILAGIIGIIIVSSTLKSIEPNEFTLGSTNETVSVIAVSLMLVSPAIFIFNTAVSSIKTAAAFTSSFVPVFAAIMVSSGKSVTATLTSGTMLLASQVVEQVSAYVVLPFLAVFLAIGIGSAFYDKLNFSMGAASIKKIITTFMTTVMMIFSGVVSLQNLIGTASDSLSLRTAKYIAGNTPIIGGAISEAVGIVTTCFTMLKTSAIIYAVITFGAILLPIIIEAIIWKIAMYIAQSVASIFSMNKISSLVETLGFTFSIVITVTINTFIMFVISLTVVALFGGSI